MSKAVSKQVSDNIKAAEPVRFTGQAIGVVRWNGLTSTVTLKIVDGVVVDKSDEHFPPDLGVLTTGRASRTLAKLCRSTDDPTEE